MCLQIYLCRFMGVKCVKLHQDDHILVNWLVRYISYIWIQYVKASNTPIHMQRKWQIYSRFKKQSMFPVCTKWNIFHYLQFACGKRRWHMHDFFLSHCIMCVIFSSLKHKLFWFFWSCSSLFELHTCYSKSNWRSLEDVLPLWLDWLYWLVCPSMTWMAEKH